MQTWHWAAQRSLLRKPGFNSPRGRQWYKRGLVVCLARPVPRADKPRQQRYVDFCRKAATGTTVRKVRPVSNGDWAALQNPGFANARIDVPLATAGGASGPATERLRRGLRNRGRHVPLSIVLSAGTTSTAPATRIGSFRSGFPRTMPRAPGAMNFRRPHPSALLPRHRQ